MKKAIFLVLLLPLLTGCWDRLNLKTLHLVDVLGFDRDEKNGDVKVDFLVTKLIMAGQGGGEPSSAMKQLNGPSLAEAIGEWDYVEQAPFLGISTRVYLISESFASQDPISELSFLLQAPYSSIRSPLIVFEGDLSKFMETSSSKNKEFTKDLNEFILSLEKNKTVPKVSMMNLIQSKDDELSDLALPILREKDSEMELGGLFLFSNGTPTGINLEKGQVKPLMLMLGGNNGRQRITGTISKNQKDKSSSEKTNEIHYGFNVKKNVSKITVSNKSNKLPKVNINVQLQISVFKLDEHELNPDYVKRMEKELSKHFEENALTVIKKMQSANSDLLGVGKELKAHHPNVWKSLDWRKDYPKMTIEPNFDIEILNASVE